MNLGCENHQISSRPLHSVHRHVKSPKVRNEVTTNNSTTSHFHFHLAAWPSYVGDGHFAEALDSFVCIRS